MSGSQLSLIPNADNNSCPGKVLDIINPRGNLQPREMARGEGCGNAGSCEGLAVSMETHRREVGWRNPEGGRENGFTKRAPQPKRKALGDGVLAAPRGDLALNLRRTKSYRFSYYNVTVYLIYQSGPVGWEVSGGQGLKLFYLFVPRTQGKGLECVLVAVIRGGARNGPIFAFSL